MEKIDIILVLELSVRNNYFSENKMEFILNVEELNVKKDNPKTYSCGNDNSFNSRRIDKDSLGIIKQERFSISNVKIECVCTKDMFEEVKERMILKIKSVILENFNKSKLIYELTLSSQPSIKVKKINENIVEEVTDDML